MTILKPVLVLVILSSALLCNNAWSTEPPPRLGALPDQPPPAPAAKADNRLPAAAPAPNAKKPPKRRAVRQILNDDVRPATSYQPRPMPPLQGPMPSAVPPSSTIINCAGGNCSDPNGGHYQGGVGTSLISPQGRLCNNNGITVQCF
jgi:hypothetical protein